MKLCDYVEAYLRRAAADEALKDDIADTAALTFR